LVKLPKTVAYRIQVGFDGFNDDYNYYDDEEKFDGFNAAGGYEMCVPDDFETRMAETGTYNDTYAHSTPSKASPRLLTNV
jgi:hypothetical protein